MKFLAVEDETPVATMMVSLLSRAGHEVKVSSTGDTGLELATAEKFDLITLDMDLPNITGFELCREFKQRHISSHTPIVFVTGRAAEERRQRAFDLGAEDLIEKPFVVPDFISRIMACAKPKNEPTPGIKL
jgi:DNA-binding response OmpR family regulator